MGQLVEEHWSKLIRLRFKNVEACPEIGFWELAWARLSISDRRALASTKGWLQACRLAEVIQQRRCGGTRIEIWASRRYAKAIRELNSKQPTAQHDSSLTRSKEDENI